MKNQRAVFILVMLLHSVSARTAYAEIEHPRHADTAKECAICHYRWVVTFFEEHRGTPLATLQEDKVVGDQEMCLSCHDGSVRDSRDKICNGPGHRVGVIPSARVRIPEKFLLDENGAMQCYTCHTPHAITRKEKTMIEFFLRAPNKNSSFCKLCHVKNTGGLEKGNHPVDISAKKFPEEISAGGGKLGLALPNQIICETCHIAHGGVNNKFLVLSVEDPKTRSVLCEVCHTKKPGLAMDPSLNRFTHPLDLAPGNPTKIPKKWRGGGEVVLGTGGELVCRTCHTPHGAVEKKALLAEHNHGDSLCIQCHKDQKIVSGSSHDLKIFAPDEKNIQGHRAADIGPCSSCHLVHQGTGPLMWARKIKNIEQKPGELCISCHCRGGAAEKIISGGFSHPMDIKLPEEKASFSLPLFDEKGRNLNGKIRCSTCHDFHSPFPFYDDPVNKGVKHSNYLRLSKEKATYICAYCHPQHGLVEGTDHDLSMVVPEFINTSGQTPEQGGICSPCHVSHGAVQQRHLWSGPIGPVMLEGWEQAYKIDNDMMTILCTGCHSPGNIAETQIPRFGLHPKGFLVPEEETVGRGPRITFEMVKKEFPIFTDTGEIAESGNIICSTCHNPHQWDPHVEAKGPGKEVEGNVTNSFLRPNLHSKFCTECHGKDGLVKFKYFHSHIGRDKEEAPFSFE